ncbi:hypothetical protein JCM19236_6423 [Vibrio sp. JCM 19236]|nr:hypothetical protein JCM19236_6423 [Vibrio sp. JCM 19236]
MGAGKIVAVIQTKVHQIRELCAVFVGKNLFLVFISALILVGVVQQYVLG